MIRELAFKVLSKGIQKTLEAGNVNTIDCLGLSSNEKKEEKKEEVKYRYLTSTQRVRVD